MRIIKSHRTHLLLLALSLFTISSIFGLSAYLTDMQRYSSSLRTLSSKELGFQITGDQLSGQIITPGETLMLPVGVSVTGPRPIYSFIDFDITERLIPYNFNSSSWHPISDGSKVYYYGTDNGLVALDKDSNPSATIFEGITLSDVAEVNESYEYSIDAYAIQTDNIRPDASPSAVFEMVMGTFTN